MQKSTVNPKTKRKMNSNNNENGQKNPVKPKASKKLQKAAMTVGDQPPNFEDDQKLKIVESPLSPSSSAAAAIILPNLWTTSQMANEEKMTTASAAVVTSTSSLLKDGGELSTTMKSDGVSPFLLTAGCPVNDEEILDSGENGGEKLLSKLKRFLKTVYYFSKNLLPQQHDFVKELILKVIGEEIDEQTFYEKLHESTRFPLRPYVVPFMRASLPLLRKEYEEAAEDIMESMLFFDNKTTDQRLTNLLANDPIMLVNAINSNNNNNTDANTMIPRRVKKSKAKDAQQQQHVLTNGGGGALIGHPTLQMGQNPMNLNMHTSNMIPSSSKRLSTGDLLLKMPQPAKPINFNNGQPDMDMLQQLMPSTFGSNNGAAQINSSTFMPAAIKQSVVGAPQLISSSTMQPLHLLNLNATAPNNPAGASVIMKSPKTDLDSANSLLKLSNNKPELMSPKDEHWTQVETLFSNMTSTLDKLRHAMLSMHQRTKLAQLWGEKCQQQNQQRQKEQSDQKIAQLRQKADAVVNEVKSAAVAELQRAVLAAEQKAAVTIASEKAKMEKLLSESQVQEDSVENCWNCGRKAGQTCSGCGCARYCGVFCQHKDWNRHRADCSKMARATAVTVTPPASTMNGVVRPSDVSTAATSTNAVSCDQAAGEAPPAATTSCQSSPTSAAAALIEFRKFFHVDPQQCVSGTTTLQENDVRNDGTCESPFKKAKTQIDRATTRSV